MRLASHILKQIIHVSPGPCSLRLVRFTSLSHLRERPLHPTLEGITTTPAKDINVETSQPTAPFYLETGYATYAKRPPRPFPPPFLSIPSDSFSDPLTTYTRTRDRRPSVRGQALKGITNGDDAVIVGGQNFLGVNDGVGAWATKERGHAALWSRLIAHFWAVEVEKALSTSTSETQELDPVAYLQTAFEQTKLATSSPNEILGTTTACSALLHHRSATEPFIYATNLGDCTIMVIRPKDQEVVYKTVEQWHWFDCPRQLGTNSPDTPKADAVMDIVDITEDDLIVVMSDGVSDNLWEHEICEILVQSLNKVLGGENGSQDGMAFVARSLVNSARAIAEDPFAESPFMERAVDEGLPMEGGKMDDISVALGLCKRRKS